MNHDNTHTSNAIESRATLRAQGPKYQIYAFRGTPSQKALLDHAAEEWKTSRQKVLDKLIWHALEEQFGHDVPIQKGGTP